MFIPGIWSIQIDSTGKPDLNFTDYLHSSTHDSSKHYQVRTEECRKYKAVCDALVSEISKNTLCQSFKAEPYYCDERTYTYVKVNNPEKKTAEEFLETLKKVFPLNRQDHFNIHIADQDIAQFKLRLQPRLANFKNDDTTRIILESEYYKRFC